MERPSAPSPRERRVWEPPVVSHDTEESVGATSGVPGHSGSVGVTSGIPGHSGSVRVTSGIPGHSSSMGATSGIPGHSGSVGATRGVQDTAAASEPPPTPQHAAAAPGPPVAPQDAAAGQEAEHPNSSHALGRAWPRKVHGAGPNSCSELKEGEERVRIEPRKGGIFFFTSFSPFWQLGSISFKKKKPQKRDFYFIYGSRQCPTIRVFSHKAKLAYEVKKNPRNKQKRYKEVYLI
ncbi:hypothetical protein NDU88_008123 [Pleurodeles waltl]|uniref:Uncharacterized protein n=1 Tax=Pleurodeles waltl TaxID=8319 RepID=A0AAV7QP09_PLEWA|nr:hypothetical protein NDU88_008123 [Pleurodeles waltl]